MAKKQGQQKIKLKSSESGHMYHTTKNTKKHRERLVLAKYDPLLRRKVEYKEVKS
ncbi:MAG: 50S ribosomal protein L33 [Vampirovibrionales bacterium]